MATTTQLVPLEVYLRSSYEPDAEYVDGEIEERPMGEFDHSSWQQALQRWFLLHERDWKIRVRPELRVQVSASRFRIPDVTVLDRSFPIEQVITHPPLAVFEVLSPEDTFQRMKRKLEDYRLMGIPEIWVIDTEDDTFYRYEDRQFLRRNSFALVEKGISFDMNQVKEFLD
jgi:Uma2 family endonuclease